MTNSPDLMIPPQFIRHPNKNEWTPANVAVRFIFLMPVSWQREEQCSALLNNGDLTTSTRTIPHLSCHNLNVSIKMYVRFDVARGLP